MVAQQAPPVPRPNYTTVNYGARFGQYPCAQQQHIPRTNEPIGNSHRDTTPCIAVHPPPILPNSSKLGPFEELSPQRKRQAKAARNPVTKKK